jgi:hypothetical protein
MFNWADHHPCTSIDIEFGKNAGYGKLNGVLLYKEKRTVCKLNQFCILTFRGRGKCWDEFICKDDAGFRM